MSIIIAFSTDAVVFQENKILDEDIAKSYPGALWVTKLAKIAEERGIKVVTGDVAILNIQAKKWRSSDILVIQDESSSIGFELLRLGAIPLILICAESPLYVPSFYANLSKTSALFKNRILFRGAFECTSLKEGNHVLHFPSFSSYSEEDNVPWGQRKFLVMVAANKYWKIKRKIHMQLMAWIRDAILGRKLYTPQEITDQQLHDRRLALVEYFGREGSLDLFGANWEDISNLPDKWRNRLEKVVEKLNPTTCTDKQSVITDYKFAICFENMVYPGYVTEKIIDCFRAGVIPIYMGAPDISDFVPKAAFLDLRGFVSLEEMHSYLKNITEDAAMEMINAAHSFLRSEKGAKYSYEGFAHNVMNLVRECE
jgi:hypothetical protein